MPLVEVRDVAKIYRRDSQQIPVLDSLSLAINAGDFLALMGPSGSGKTTLLNLIGGLDQPSAGDIVVDGVNIARLRGRELARWRAHHIGFIFQLYNLIPVLTALENVELPLLERLNRELGKTIIMVTHDPHAAERAHRVLHLEKGELSR